MLYPYFEVHVICTTVTLEIRPSLSWANKAVLWLMFYIIVDLSYFHRKKYQNMNTDFVNWTYNNNVLFLLL